MFVCCVFQTPIRMLSKLCAHGPTQTVRHAGTVQPRPYRNDASIQILQDAEAHGGPVSETSDIHTPPPCPLPRNPHPSSSSSASSPLLPSPPIPSVRPLRPSLRPISFPPSLHSPLCQSCTPPCSSLAHSLGGKTDVWRARP